MTPRPPYSTKKVSLPPNSNPPTFNSAHSLLRINYGTSPNGHNCVLLPVCTPEIWWNEVQERWQSPYRKAAVRHSEHILAPGIKHDVHQVRVNLWFIVHAGATVAHILSCFHSLNMWNDVKPVVCSCISRAVFTPNCSFTAYKRGRHTVSTRFTDLCPWTWLSHGGPQFCGTVWKEMKICKYFLFTH